MWAIVGGSPLVVCRMHSNFASMLPVAYREGFPEHIHNSFSPYMVLVGPYMVKMNCEYVQETPLDTPLGNCAESYTCS